MKKILVIILTFVLLVGCTTTATKTGQGVQGVQHQGYTSYNYSASNPLASGSANPTALPPAQSTGQISLNIFRRILRAVAIGAMGVSANRARNNAQWNAFNTNMELSEQTRQLEMINYNTMPDMPMQGLDMLNSQPSLYDKYSP